ncbi:MAG: DUF131 domain-containing protein [Candidatus Thermoplasmatota archaeon]|nr:DUF131 domain-containing protein [Candidatus Thermoplasmatota archaeon]
MENKIPAILFIFGIICIIAGFAAGEGKAGIFIIFPFIYGNGPLMLMGMLLIFISFVIFIFSTFSKAQSMEDMPLKTEKHAGGLILIGPIPIVISSDKKLALVLMAIGIFIAFIFLFLWVYAGLH